MRCTALYGSCSAKRALLGEYDFSNDKLQDNTGVLPPKSVTKIIPENWEPPTR